MKAKKYNKGGKVKGKGMTTSERKKQYMDSVKKKQEKEKAELRKKNSSKLATSYGSTRVISPSLEETVDFVSGALDNIEAKREEKKYKPAREAASKRFDEATKYDELLGRSTNPDKYSKGGIMKAKKKYKGGGKLDAALRAELKKKTTKAKPKANVKSGPIERVSKVAKDSGKGYGTVAYDAISSDEFQNIPYSKRTFGDVANAAEKQKYEFGGKIYKDGGLALFKALKKKFGES